MIEKRKNEPSSTDNKLYSECCFLEIPENSLRAIWEVTHYCPFDCKYCFTSSGPHMPLNKDYFNDNYNKIIEAFIALGVRDILITGGEPLALGYDLIKAIKLIKAKGIDFSISTSGYDYEHFKALIETGPRMVNLSYDPGLLREANKSDLEKVTQLLSLCDKFNVQVKISGVVMPGEKEFVEKYFEVLFDLLSKYTNIKKLAVKNAYSIGAFKLGPKLPPEDMKEYAYLFDHVRAPEETEKLAFVNWPYINAPLQKCKAGKSFIGVLPNGDYTACSLLYYMSETTVLGNILVSSTSDVKMKLMRFAEDIKIRAEELKNSDKVCSRCKVYDKCGGGCYTMMQADEKSEASLVCRFH